MFLIGLLNGLLPCGLVYVAIAGATATGHFINGALFMFLFGLGTLPMMLSLSLFGQFIQAKYRNLMRKAVPVFVSAMAIMMILRGLNLGIPYVSPKIEEKETSGMECHSQGTEKVMKCCAKPGSTGEGNWTFVSLLLNQHVNEPTNNIVVNPKISFTTLQTF